MIRLALINSLLAALFLGELGVTLIRYILKIIEDARRRQESSTHEHR